MLRKLLKFGTLISLCLIAVGLGEFIFTLQQARHVVARNSTALPQEPLMSLPFEEQLARDSIASMYAEEENLSEAFLPDQFHNPPLQFRPWTRWWLPGNKLDRLELIREIQLFWETGFGGLEIYPTSAGLNPDLPGQETQQIFEVGNLAYAHHLNLILEELAKRNMQADLLLGTGSPTGGAHVSLLDNMQTLAFGESYVLGGKTVDIRLPSPRLPGSYLLSELSEHPNTHPNEGEWLHFDGQHKQLLALYATKYRRGNRTWPALDINDYLLLDKDSTLQITPFVNENNRLNWNAPKGYWKIIAIYTVPNGERPIFSAAHKAGLILNPFDSAKVVAHHNWLIGNQTYLQKYIGHGLRGIFHDHFSYHVDRHYAEDIIEDFEQDHGYDLYPYLPVLLQPGKNHSLMQAAEWKSSPEFQFTDWDNRIQYDYSLSLSNRFIHDYLQTSMDWAESNQLLTRVQPYGAEIDIIKSAAYTHIPEVEQLYGGGSEAFLKLISSGAHWAHKQIISAETGAHKDMPGSMFPLRLKRAADKLFLAGVNQIVLHGSPYRTYIDEAGNKLWHPFSSPYLRDHQISGNFSESSPFWKHQQEMNAYLSRCQYLMRQGKPVIDVLIYYPFLGFPRSFENQMDHEETYFNGVISDYSKVSRDSDIPLPISALDRQEDPRNLWLKQVWPLIRVLDEAGVNWSWVNDELLAEINATEAGDIALRGYSSQMLLIPHAPHIQPGAAESIVQASRDGGRVVIYGSAPQTQPGFSQRESHDKLIQTYFMELMAHQFVQTPAEFKNLLTGYPIHQAVSFDGHLPFFRQIQRITDEGDVWMFVNNTLDQDRFLSLRAHSSFEQYYWFDPQNGQIHQAKIGEEQVIKSLFGPYESKILLASQSVVIDDSLISPVPVVQTDFWSASTSRQHQLQTWDLIVPVEEEKNSYLEFQDTILRDWRQIDNLTYSKSEGLYSHHITVGDTLPNKQYILDLGQLMASADIIINTIPAGSLFLPPYRMDITGHLIPGDNIIEIWVKPPTRNHLIGLGKKGDPLYQVYQTEDSVLVEAGLLGPVHIWEVDRPSIP